jgi:CspA family cold shock protein
MNVKNSLAALATAAILAFVAYLIELSSTQLPNPIGYFAIALLAAMITLFVTNTKASFLRKRAKKQFARHHSAAAKHGPKETGSVKWFSSSKGFGFITRENGEDIFVHFRSISGEGHRILREGQKVEFAVTEGSKGLQAEDVIALK